MIRHCLTRAFAWTALTLAVLAAGRPAGAVESRVWRTAGREAFLAADFESLSVSSEGGVTLAPALEHVEGIEAAYVWSLLAGPGGVVIAGTGNGGILYRASGLQGSRLHDSVTLQIESLAMGPGGIVYAGTAPDATILAVGPDGAARIFADLPDHHVWGLDVDGDGTVWAATGEGAHFYAIGQDGSPRLVFTAPAGHLTAMARKGDGFVLGAEADGLVYEVKRDGRARVLLDASEVEVRGLAVATDGTVYAGVNRDLGETLGGGPAGGNGEPGRGKEGKEARPGPVVYRIRPDGASEPIWNCPDATIQCFRLAPDNSLLVGTGGETGGLYRIDPATREWRLLSRPGTPQVLSVAVSDGELFLGTGAPGFVFRGRLAGSPGGLMISTVNDAHQPSDWGVIRWDGVAVDHVRFRTRSGNTGEPDATWSDWSAPLTDPAGSPITSPPARFIQWEATFTAGTPAPELREVTVAWAEKNLGPLVSRVTVSEPGEPLGRGGENGGPQPVVQTLAGNVRAEFSVSTQASRQPAGNDESAWARRYRTVRWDATDPNEDRLTYRLERRAGGDEVWRLIEKDLREPLYVWDTSSVPDGDYWLRVTASDELANSPGEELSAGRTTDRVRVDNTPPRVEGLAASAGPGGTIMLQARLIDDLGPLQQADVSFDGRNWRPLLPVDRVFDERVEEASVTLAPPPVDLESREIHLRVFDGAGNIGVARVPRPGSGQ